MRHNSAYIINTKTLKAQHLKDNTGILTAILQSWNKNRIGLLFPEALHILLSGNLMLGHNIRKSCPKLCSDAADHISINSCQVVFVVLILGQLILRDLQHSKWHVKCVPRLLLLCIGMSHMQSSTAQLQCMY